MKYVNKSFSYSKTTKAINTLDTDFAIPISYRLEHLYQQKFGTTPGNTTKIKLKKFAKLIGKIFKIPVPKIKLMKAKKLKKKFQYNNIYGVCVVDNKKCKVIYLQRELVKSGDIKSIYITLLHELRHCWQTKDFDYYYGADGDTLELEALREADAHAFAELIFFYLFKEAYIYENAYMDERLHIDDRKNKIRMGLWEQIKKYYKWHGDLRTFKELKVLEKKYYKPIMELQKITKKKRSNLMK